MSDLIYAALIGAISAVTVALINCYALIRTKTEPSHKKVKRSSPEIKKPRFKYLTENGKYWIMIMFILVPWLIFSPLKWGISLGVINLIFLIPAITIILAFVTPINPVTAIFTVLAIHPINLYIADFSVSRAVNDSLTSNLGSPLYKLIVSMINGESLPWILLTITVNLILVYSICRYRIGRSYKK